MQLYRRGDSGPAVREIRARLAGLGFLDAYNGSSFDDACDTAVRAFQQHRGLMVDGIVGPQTYRALDEARWKLGDRLLHYQVTHPIVGDDVVTLQARLLDLGFHPGAPPDGVFGPATDEALREFQRNVGLPADGLFGPGTLREMERLRRAVVGGAPAALREVEALHRSGRTLAGKTVVIDAGHGADDPGIVVDGLCEADLVFDLAARLEGRIGAVGGYAYLTRSREGNPSDSDRAAFANAAEADVVVSVHLDGAASPTCQGVASYYYGGGSGGGSAAGEKLAELTQREIVARTDLLDTRTHAKSWDLLRLTRMPAVRVEVGYLSNPHDRARLAEASFRDVVADALLAALQRLYLGGEDDPGTGQLRLPALSPS